MVLNKVACKLCKSNKKGGTLLMKEKELMKKTSVVTQSGSNTAQISSGGGRERGVENLYI